MNFEILEIRVADWPLAVAWYRDVLGLPVVLEDGPHRYALLDAGGAKVALRGDDRPGGREAVRLIFRVEDLAAERSRLIGLGVAVGEPIENRAEGYREIRLADPEGAPIRVFAWMS